MFLQSVSEESPLFQIIFSKALVVCAPRGQGITLKPRVIRKPRYYGQFSISLGKEYPYIFSKFNLINTDTPSIRTLSMAPSV